MLETLCSRQMQKICAGLLAWFLMSLTVAFGAPKGNVRWYVVTEKLNDQGNSLTLGDGSQTMQLKNGWSCSIAAASKHLSLYEARQTTCKKGRESFKFSVQCEQNHSEDHVQIGFQNSEEKLTDFIEVGCKADVSVR